ncbi:DNA damage-regulated autophagy modulator protein 1-like [Ptychodera flava]|uniref:DNA damage-regulated autophagy modulator protein 1-like n=1 Tax=Ptychodera flava TaxID=63121 RepID=UPI00396A52DF
MCYRICSCWCRGLGYLPIMLGVMSGATFITSYVIAVIKGDVFAVFPYISDTGTKPPESCIFGQFLNLSAFLAFATMYVRYKQVAEFYAQDVVNKILKLNKTAFVIGSFSCLGLSIVANFQETSVIVVHGVGATMVFGLGVLYAFLQTIMTYKMYPDRNGLFICRVRMIISSVALVSMVIAFSAAAVAYVQWNKYHDQHDDRQHWRPSDGGYTAHLVSSIGEWMMAFSFLLFFFTYIRDFQKVDMEAQIRLYVEHLDEIPENEEPNERSRLIN